MSKKDQEKPIEVKLPQSPASYSYRGNELISIPADLFMLLWRANEDAIQASIERQFFSIPEWVSSVTGGVLATTPTQEEMQKGLVRQTTSLQKTFDGKDMSNFHESFKDWVYPNVINAKVAINEVHAKMIEDGVATPIEILKAEDAASREVATDQGKAEPIANMEIVAEAPKEQEVEQAQVPGPEGKIEAKPDVVAKKPRKPRKPRATKK